MYTYVYIQARQKDQDANASMTWKVALQPLHQEKVSFFFIMLFYAFLLCLNDLEACIAAVTSGEGENLASTKRV